MIRWLYHFLFVQLNPISVWFLFFKGRLQLVQGRVDEAIVDYKRSWKSQDIWPQFHHFCYWELMWAHRYRANHIQQRRPSVGIIVFFNDFQLQIGLEVSRWILAAAAGGKSMVQVHIHLSESCFYVHAQRRGGHEHTRTRPTVQTFQVSRHPKAPLLPWPFLWW